MKLRVLYISGLGDNYDGFRRFALRFWNLWGVKAELVPMEWSDGKGLADKLARVERALADSNDKEECCVLVGESAGASISLIAADRFPAVYSVATICGVAQSATPIAAHLRRKHPALHEAVNQLTAIDVPTDVRLESVRSISDPVVGKRYSVARGAQEHVIWVTGHFATIVACLTVLSLYIISLLRPKTRVLR